MFESVKEILGWMTSLGKKPDQSQSPHSAVEPTLKAKREFLASLESIRVTIQSRPAKAEELFMASLRKGLAGILDLKHAFTFEEAAVHLGRRHINPPARDALRALCIDINASRYKTGKAGTDKLSKWIDAAQNAFEMV